MQVSLMGSSSPVLYSSEPCKIVNKYKRETEEIAGLDLFHEIFCFQYMKVGALWNANTASCFKYESSVLGWALSYLARRDR